MAERNPSEREANGVRRKARGWLRPVLFLAGIVALFIVTSHFLPLGRYLEGALEWVKGIGVLGALILGTFYVVACVLLVPGLILTLAAGFLFGILWGTVTVSIASTLGACAAFLVGRTIARRWIAKKVESKPKFAAIDEAVGREGFKIVLLTRLSPIFPFNLLNYAFGLTKVRFRDYALASWIGMLPGTVMYVYFGSALGKLAGVAAGETKGGTTERIFFIVGLLIAVGVAFFVTHVARKALKRAAPRAAEAASAQQNQGGLSDA